MLAKNQTKKIKKFNKIFALCMVIVFMFVLGGTMYAVNYSMTPQTISVATTSENKQVQQKTPARK